MNIATEALRETVRRAIALQQQAQTEWDENVANARAEHERVWREEQLPQWRDVRDRITKALKNGGHITDEMLPNGGGRYSTLTYKEFKSTGRYPTHTFGDRPVLQVRKLEALLAFLDAIPDETVTQASLDRAGFSKIARLYEGVHGEGTWG